MADWFRVPPWCMATHTEPSAERARAWVYLLGAWHAGDAPSTREVRRVTGFGGGRADALVRDVLAWALANGARTPPGVAGQERGRSGADAGRDESGSTPDSTDNRGTTGADAGRDRGVSRARVPSLETDERSEDQDQHQGDAQHPTRKADPEPRSHLDTDPTLTDTSNGEPMQLFGKEIPHPADTRIVDPPKAPPLPSWVPKDTRPYARADVAGMVLSIVAEHRRPAGLDASEPTPEIAGDVRCKGDAKTVLALWSYLERPPLGEFAADVIAVIRAAKPGGCPHRKFARDIRAEGWEGGTDRHRDLDSVLVHARWEMRRTMAREWVEHPERFGAEPIRPIKPPDNRDVLSFFR